jgi:hypothetical protein
VHFGGRDGLRLVSQPITVAPDADLVIDLAVDPSLSSTAPVIIEARPIGASDFANGLAELPAAPADQLVVAGPPAVTRSGAALRLVVPTESTAETPQRLRLNEAGAYAITVRAETAQGVLTTPIVRLAGPVAPEVRVAIAAVVDSPLTLQPNGDTSIDPAVRAELTALVGLLERAVVPLTVTVRPELLRGLTRSGVPGDAELVTRLGAALAHHTLLAAPYVHLDPSAAAATSALPEVFTSQLRKGEDTLSELLGQFPDRRVWVATDPLSTAGGALVRNLGANVVLRLAGAGLAPGRGEPSPPDNPLETGGPPIPVVLPPAPGAALQVG